MNLNELYPFAEERKSRKRVGRGSGSGLGCTSGKGNKGQNARSGGGVRPGFEGGQMPLQRRLPKFGFKNINRVEYKAVNLGMLAELAEARQLQKIGIEELRAAGILRRGDLVKVLAGGSIAKALEIEANAFSAAAKAAIEAAGGSAKTI